MKTNIESKERCFLEATLNSVSSLPTAWVCWSFIIVPWSLLLSWELTKLGFFQIPLGNTMFTIVGILRSYFRRCWFEERRETKELEI